MINISLVSVIFISILFISCIFYVLHILFKKIKALNSKINTLNAELEFLLNGSFGLNNKVKVLSKQYDIISTTVVKKKTLNAFTKSKSKSNAKSNIKSKPKLNNELNNKSDTLLKLDDNFSDQSQHGNLSKMELELIEALGNRDLQK